jgi:heat shock protein HtpX
MTSYFDEIAMNRAKSFILLFAFSLLFLAIIYFFVILLGGGMLGLVLGLLLVICYAAFTYFFGANFVLSLSGAKEVDRKSQPVLYEIIEGLSAAMQLPMPKVYVINDPNPNAFESNNSNARANTFRN